MGTFTYAPKPKPNSEPKTCTILIFFFGFGGRILANTTGNFNKICTYTTMCIVYNLVIMKAIDGLSCETIVTSSIPVTTDFCGTIPRATIKTTNLMQWYCAICIVKVFLLSEREISPNYTDIFLDFVHRFGSYVKGLPKTKRCNSVAVSVRFRFGFGVYVKQPYNSIYHDLLL